MDGKAIRAIRHNRVDLLEECINEGIDPNKLDEKGRSLMFIAITHGNSECLKILLNAGGDVNMCDRRGRSLMYVAIAYAFMCVKVLLQQDGIEIDAKTFVKMHGRHFEKLMHNQEFKKLEKTVISKYNSVDIHGKTLIRVAVENSNAPIVQQLIEAGVNVNTDDFDGKTLIRVAVENSNATIVQQLIRAGANVNTDGFNGKTLIRVAVENSNAPIVKQLIEARTDVNTDVFDGKTLIRVAVENSDATIVQQLIRARANVNTDGFDGKTLIRVAVENSNATIVQQLIRAGANVNRAGFDGKTPMKVAMEQISVHEQNYKIFKLIIQLLLNAGADLTEFNVFLWKHSKFRNETIVHRVKKLPETPLETATRAGRIEHVKYFIGAGCSVTRSVLALAGDNVDMLKILWGHYDTMKKNHKHVSYERKTHISSIEFDNLRPEQKIEFKRIVRLSSIHVHYNRKRYISSVEFDNLGPEQKDEFERRIMRRGTVRYKRRKTNYNSFEFDKLSPEQKSEFNAIVRRGRTYSTVPLGKAYLHPIPRCPVLAGNFGEIKYFVPHERHCIMLVLFCLSRTSFLPENSLRQRCFLYVTFGWMM